MKVKQLLLTSSLLFAFAQSSSGQCMPNYLFGCVFGDSIRTFTVTGDVGVISTTNSPCTPAAYEDITGASVTFTQGGSYTASISSGTVNDNAQIYIDFNNNNTFETTESVGGVNSIAQYPTTTNFTINIPAGAQINGHRMRLVMSGDSTYPTINPCPWNQGLSGYGTGEVHDYTAVILQGCDTPTNLAATAVTFNGTTLTWTPVTGAQGYMYGVTSTLAPPTSGSYTTTTSGAVTGLMSAMPYYGWVRTVCAPGDSSVWVHVQFTTSLCPAPTGINATSVTSTSATIGWTAVSGAQGYQYNATTLATPPATGIYTTSNSGPVTGLTASTGYYAWVRTVCSQGDTSSWASNQFTTTSSVSSIGYKNFSFEAYPNPVKNIMTVAALGNRSGIGTIQLTDFTGKIVKNYTLDASEMTIDMSAVAPGVYFIRYTDAEHRQTLKVIKD